MGRGGVPTLLDRTESHSGEEDRLRYVILGCLSSKPTSGPCHGVRPKKGVPLARCEVM